MKLDPVDLEVIRHALEGVADEMGAVLRRTSISPNIKERMDCSAAVFSPEGELIAQAEHIPVHLGSMPASVEAALAAYPRLRPGDQVLLNDPWGGGTHVNDLTLVAPVHAGRALIGYVANRAHHTDVGGSAAGSIPAGATEIFHEGVRIPPILMYRGGELDAGVLGFVRANSRTPQEREGDLLAQAGANARGAERMAELAARYGRAVLRGATRELMDYAEVRVRAALAELPRGEWTFSDALDDDGTGSGPVTIRCALRISSGEVEIDLSGSDDQVRGNVNTVAAAALSAACFALRLLVPPDVPVNAGCWRPLRFVVRPGSVVGANPPAGVGAGNTECSQRICDTILGAFAMAVPDRMPAANQGTMNNLLIGGLADDGRPFSYYETVGGGQGGAPWGPGMSGVHTGMTNTRNTPIEALEHAYPLRAIAYELRSGSGGAGRNAGGDGVVRELETLCEEATVTLICDRRARGPWGAAGGFDGAPGVDYIDGETVPAKLTRRVPRGTRVRIETPGGGGWGVRGARASEASGPPAGSTKGTASRT
jgi:N-methylhydantoinase B